MGLDWFKVAVWLACGLICLTVWAGITLLMVSP